MKNRLGLLILVTCSYLFINILMAEDEAKKETLQKEASKAKPEIKDLELTGMVLETDKANVYYIQTAEKLSVHLPNKIGDKEIALELYKNKQVVAKGKGEKTTSKEGIITNIKLTQLISIELEPSAGTKREKQSNEPKKEKDKIDIGNQYDN